MRRILALVAAFVLVGCETSQIDSDAVVTVTGRIVRADGSPAAGVPVGLERQPSAGEVVSGLVIVPLTLFTACLADPPPALCRGRSVRRATTRADGTYDLRIEGDDTQTAFGNARTMSLSAELPPAAGEITGAAVSASFKVQTITLPFRDFQMWQPELTVAAGRIGWEPLVDAGNYEVGVEDAGGRHVWSFDSSGRNVTFDPRVLEDTAGSLAVSARSQTTAEGTTVSMLHRSARVGYRSAAGPPASRGQSCVRRDAAVARCPLTDGDFTTRLPAPAIATTTTASPAPTLAATDDWVSIDLGRPRDVSLVVVRGCSCQVEGSVDGNRWTPLGRSSGFTAVTPARTGPVRYVRLTGSLTELGEVSVWDTTPTPPPPAAAAPEPAAGAPPVNPVFAPSSPSRAGPAVVALAALLVAAVLTAATARRRD